MIEANGVDTPIPPQAASADARLSAVCATCTPPAVRAVNLGKQTAILAARYADHLGAWPDEATRLMEQLQDEHEGAGEATVVTPSRTPAELRAKAEALLTFATLRKDGSADGSLCERLAVSLVRDLLRD